MHKCIAFVIAVSLLGMAFSSIEGSNLADEKSSEPVVSTPIKSFDTPEVPTSIIREPVREKIKTKSIIPAKDDYSKILNQLQSLWDNGRSPIFQSLLSARLYTRCGEVEKNTSILYGLLLPLDVDDNSGTGQNGNDIRTRFYLLPTLRQEHIGWALGLSLVVEVDRLGEEIAHEDIEIAFELSINLVAYDYGTHNFRLGLASRLGKELPQQESIIFTVYPYLFYEHSPDFVLQHTPVFNAGPSNLDVIAHYSGSYDDNSYDHKIILGFSPAVQANMNFSPTISRKEIDISFFRTAAIETVLSIGYEGKTNNEDMHINLTIDPLPYSMDFSLGYNLDGKGGNLNYDASEEFNVILTINIERVELMGCIQIMALPVHLSANWQYQVMGGYLDVSTSSSKTSLTICDSLEDPTIRFQLSNITNTLNLSWGLDQEGFLFADADHPGPMIDFYWLIDSLRLQSTSKMNTDYLYLAWNIAEEGYVIIDTDNNWLTTFTFNFSVGDNIGIDIGANLLKTQNFRLQWALWPPGFEVNGDIQIVGDFYLTVMLNGSWYPFIMN